MSLSHVAVVYGGPSSEHEVSLESGEECLRALAKTPLEITPVRIDRQGIWHLSFPNGNRQTLPSGPAVEELRRQGVQCALLALHGLFGEDGTVQALLRAHRLPYTGSGLRASAVAFDKRLSKILALNAGLTLAPDHLVTAETDLDSLPSLVARDLGLPCFVKPSSSGSSVGVSRCTRVEDVRSKVEEAMGVDGSTEVLVEKAIRGREMTVGVMDGRRGPEALPPLEIRPADGREFFDYGAKYTPGEAEEICPAHIEPELEDRLSRDALMMYRTVGCAGLARVDFIVSDKEPYFLEVNTLPGLTKGSLFPKMLRAANVPFEQFLLGLIDQAFAHARGSSEAST